MRQPTYGSRWTLRTRPASTTSASTSSSVGQGRHSTSGEPISTAVLALPDAPEHLSLYSLIVEPGTPFADAAARGILPHARRRCHRRHVRTGDRDPRVGGMAPLRGRQLVTQSRRILPAQRDLLATRRFSGHRGGRVRHGREPANDEPSAAGDAIAPRSSGANPGHPTSKTIDPATSMAETMLLGSAPARRRCEANAFASRHGITLDEAYGPTIDDLAQIGLLERTGDRRAANPAWIAARQRRDRPLPLRRWQGPVAPSSASASSCLRVPARSACRPC